VRLTYDGGMSASNLSIGAVAKQTGCTVPTIRYYEEIGQPCEMPCIAGVGGYVPALVRVVMDAAARSRPILAIDGCALVCVKRTLACHGVVATRHLAL